MKKYIAILIAALMMFSMVGCGGSDTSTEVASDETVEETTETADSEEPANDKAALQDAFEESVGNGLVTFESDVRNDATGNWRLAKYASSENIVDHLKEYYEAYFESDDEIHFVINFTLGTTTVIRSSGESLTVSVHEYYDGEEHDAKVMPGGAVLQEYVYYLDTGELEEL